MVQLCFALCGCGVLLHLLLHVVTDCRSDAIRGTDDQCWKNVRHHGSSQQSWEQVRFFDWKLLSWILNKYRNNCISQKTNNLIVVYHNFMFKWFSWLIECQQWLNRRWVLCCFAHETDHAGTVHYRMIQVYVHVVRDEHWYTYHSQTHPEVSQPEVTQKAEWGNNDHG